MRIAMLGHKRIPSREGGVEIVVEELAVRMVERGHHVTAYNRSGHHVSGREFDGERRTSYQGIRLKSVFTINIKGIAAMTASVFASLCAAFGRYEVVHFHTEGACATLWVPKLLGKRCVVTVHGLDHQRSKWKKFAQKYILLGEKCAVRYADEIIVLSQNVQRYFKEKYNRDTLLIPNGVVPAALQAPELIRDKYGLEKEDYLLYLGRITPEKGIHYLIEAYKELKTIKKLVIAGGLSDSDDYFDQLKAMAEGNDSIVFTGFVQGRMLQELYSNAYLYVLPSELEGMPLSLLEAMSYGNCCVVSDIPECTEVVEDKGVVFEKGNVHALRDTLQRLLNDRDAVTGYKAGAAGFVCEKFNWDDVVEQTLDVYGRIKR